MSLKCTVKNDSATADVRWNIAPGGAETSQAAGTSHDFDVSDPTKNVRYIRNEAQDEASVDVTNTSGGPLAIVSKQVTIDTLADGATGTYALPPRPDGIRVELPA